MASIPKDKDLYLPESRNTGATKAVLIMTANGTEDLEFFYPFYRFIEAGYRVDVATPKGGKLKAKHGLELQETSKIADAHAANYDLLYIPGGKAPEELKRNTDALMLAQNFARSHKPIAAMCHGPQVLAAAGLIEGRTVAAWPEIEDELQKAGAVWANEETALDGRFITARWPGDLPATMKQVLGLLKGEAKGGMQSAA